MAAVTTLFSIADLREIDTSVAVALENYRSWAGGLGLVHNNFGADWAMELSHAAERVLNAFDEFLAQEPTARERESVEAVIRAEGLNIPSR